MGRRLSRHAEGYAAKGIPRRYPVGVTGIRQTSTMDVGAAGTAVRGNRFARNLSNSKVSTLADFGIKSRKADRLLR